MPQNTCEIIAVYNALLRDYMEWGMQLVLSGLNKIVKYIASTIIGLLALAIVVVLITVLTKVYENSGNVKNDVYVLEVKDCAGVSDDRRNCFVTASDEHTFLFSEHVIYGYSEGKLITVKDLGQEDIEYMVATDKYLIYYTGDAITYRINIETREEDILFEDLFVDGIYVNGNDYFISGGGSHKEENKETYFHETYLFEDDEIEGIKLGTYLEEYDEIEECLAGYELVLKGEYGNYTIYGGHKKGSTSNVLAFVQTEDELCLFGKQAVYLLDGRLLSFDGREYVFDGKSYEIQILYDERVGVFANLSTLYDDKIYALCQVGTGYTAGKPNPTRNKYDVLVQISPIDGEEKIIYKTDKTKSRIVGFDMPNNVIYLYNSDGEVCRTDLSTNEETVLMDGISEENRIYFEWCADRLFVFEEEDSFDYKFIGAVQ